MTTDELKAMVRDVPDFPTEGIVFKDLMPLIGHAEAFRSDDRAPRGVGRGRGIPT